jgi:hypothetical protein
LGHGGIDEIGQRFAAEEGEHFGGFGGVGADMAADKLVGMSQVFFGQRHSLKLGFGWKKSERDLLPKTGEEAFFAGTIYLVGKQKTPQLMVFLTQNKDKFALWFWADFHTIF